MEIGNAANDDLGLLIHQAYEQALRGVIGVSLGPDEIVHLPPPGPELASTGANARYLAHLIFTSSRSRIEPRPRTMHFSANFSSDLRRVQFEPKLTRLLRMLERGDRRLDDPAEKLRSPRLEGVFHKHRGIVVRDQIGRPKVFQDYLLYDWDINHFHIEPNRGRYLLYAAIKPDDVYIIKIGRHGTDFADPALLGVVESEWPGLLPTIEHLTPPSLSPADISNLRRNNAAYAADAGGRAVMPVTMRSTSGMPVHVTQSQDMARERLVDVEARLSKDRNHVQRIGGSVQAIEIDVVVWRHCPFPTRITAVGRSGRIIFQEAPDSAAPLQRRCAYPPNGID